MNAAENIRITKSVGDILDEIKTRLAKRRDVLYQENPFLSILPTQDDHKFYLFSA